MSFTRASQFDTKLMLRNNEKSIDRYKGKDERRREEMSLSIFNGEIYICIYTSGFEF